MILQTYTTGIIVNLDSVVLGDKVHTIQVARDSGYAQ